MAYQAQANAEHLAAKQHAALDDLAAAQAAANSAYAAAQGAQANAYAAGHGYGSVPHGSYSVQKTISHVSTGTRY